MWQKWQQFWKVGGGSTSHWYSNQISYDLKLADTTPSIVDTFRLGRQQYTLANSVPALADTVPALSSIIAQSIPQHHKHQEIGGQNDCILVENSWREKPYEKEQHSTMKVVESFYCRHGDSERRFLILIIILNNWLGWRGILFRVITQWDSGKSNAWFFLRGDSGDFHEAP